MTRALLIGNGAREHAIAASLVRSGVTIHSHMQMSNPGIASISEQVTIGEITNPADLPDLHNFDYAIIGPEAPLASGVSDFIEKKGIPVVAPLMSLARVETSKAYAREILARAAPNANPLYAIIDSVDELNRFVSDVGIDRIVVKPDGLTGGKGVKIFGEHLHSKSEVEDYIKKLLKTHESVILEEKLIGTEFTLQSFVDGSHIELLPLVRDYKRAYDNDEGPNTGSMGSYSRETHDLGYLSETDVTHARKIMQSVIDRLGQENGTNYKGVLYGQFIKTDDGIKVIEFNARFGDPEAMNVLSIMTTSFDEVCQQIIDGNLKRVEFERKATVCVYVVPEGYPGPDTIRDSPITIEDAMNSRVYFASVYESNGQIFTTGSRAIAVLGMGDTVKDARANAYSDVSRIHGRVRFRSDIAAGVY